MKKIQLAVITLLSSFIASAQGPTIYGTFLPVNGTSIKQVWDTTSNVYAVPTPGKDTIWDYSMGVFSDSIVYQIDTKDPVADADFSIKAPSSAAFGLSKNAAFIRAIPKAATADSLYLFYQTDYNGLRMVGAFDDKKKVSFGAISGTKAGTKYNVKNPELVAPFSFKYGDPDVKDTMIANSVNLVVNGFIAADHQIKRIKTMSVIGYGTLKLPGVTYNDVLLTKEVIIQIDSVKTNLLPNPTIIKDTLTRYTFLRNNTFATSVLMFMQDNDVAGPGLGKSDMAWYTLPVDFGEIGGTVRDSSNALLNQGKNYVLLYREGGNFTQNDVLAITKVKNDGTYYFDSIPYGYYRLAVQADTIDYKNALTTYYTKVNSILSGTTWEESDTLNTITCTCDVNNADIKLKYHKAGQISVTLTGKINANYPYVGAPAEMKATGGGKNGGVSVLGSTKPVGGIDIIVKKQPTGSSSSLVKTDANGNYKITDLESNGTYEIYVDVPGLIMANSYTVTVSNGQVISCLDYALEADFINTTCVPQSVNTITATNFNASIYPNPAQNQATLTLELKNNEQLTIDVLDYTGRKLHTLLNEQKQAGVHTIDLGIISTKAKGIYFVTIRAGNSIQTLKYIHN